MKRQNERKSDRRDATLTVWLPALVAMGIMVTGFVGTLVVLQLDAFRPIVGDIVVFAPNSQDADVWQLQVPATKVDRPHAGAACALNPTVMATSGGSLVVESRVNSSPPVYRLHWAGARTENGSGDCGASADITVSRIDLQKLANAAGGFGVNDKGAIR